MVATIKGDSGFSLPCISVTPGLRWATGIIALLTSKEKTHKPFPVSVTQTSPGHVTPLHPSPTTTTMGCKEPSGSCFQSRYLFPALSMGLTENDQLVVIFLTCLFCHHPFFFSSHEVGDICSVTLGWRKRLSQQKFWCIFLFPGVWPDAGKHCGWHGWQLICNNALCTYSLWTKTGTNAATRLSWVFTRPCLQTLSCPEQPHPPQNGGVVSDKHRDVTTVVAS